MFLQRMGGSVSATIARGVGYEVNSLLLPKSFNPIIFEQRLNAALNDKLLKIYKSLWLCVLLYQSCRCEYGIVVCFNFLLLLTRLYQKTSRLSFKMSLLNKSN